MRAVTIENETLVIGRPENWDLKRDGPCGGLSVHRCENDQNGLPMMISRWELEPGDLEKLAAGAPIYLSVYGTVHPVVCVYPGEPTRRPS